ncbi:hypothetical protein A2716_00915 [candidate division WWE3 bacterium RIFCSPHIGHO2_01_FULL_40_23]|uniref:Uncharacterized protein n=1 Tax=candidate division WWE3 bacterium RIFCSPLOWO2_01_FULL_41_18 TaxID=1802625 RepID=A0A1F4VE74_UNCKA|nr:MAG: hypothetical protein A2716_00915 [candidate division WWE3 bacterium RIFCSPHIGHO2_01_FULL_40_23]OGC55552.1 MAG: hypothetical protein A3A78_01185 [candidate division WWE3 bacterium RIFCSPLOWO2_01_FULL_41_18]
MHDLFMHPDRFRDQGVEVGRRVHVKNLHIDRRAALFDWINQSEGPNLGYPIPPIKYHHIVEVLPSPVVPDGDKAKTHLQPSFPAQGSSAYGGRLRLLKSQGACPPSGRRKKMSNCPPDFDKQILIFFTKLLLSKFSIRLLRSARNDVKLGHSEATK